MKNKHKQKLKIYVANGSAIVGAILLKKLMDKLFEETFDEEPPKKPIDDDDTSWGEALGWAALNGALAGALKLAIRRGGVEMMV